MKKRINPFSIFASLKMLNNCEKDLTKEINTTRTICSMASKIWEEEEDAFTVVRQQNARQSNARQ